MRKDEIPTDAQLREWYGDAAPAARRIFESWGSPHWKLDDSETLDVVDHLALGKDDQE